MQEKERVKEAHFATSQQHSGERATLTLYQPKKSIWWQLVYVKVQEYWLSFVLYGIKELEWIRERITVVMRNYSHLLEAVGLPFAGRPFAGISLICRFRDKSTVYTCLHVLICNTSPVLHNCSCPLKCIYWSCEEFVGTCNGSTEY